MKKIASAPYLWIAVAALFVWVGFSLFTGTKVERIDTSQGLQLLKGKTVEQALVVDGDQRVQLTLTEPFKVGDKDFGKTVEFFGLRDVHPDGFSHAACTLDLTDCCRRRALVDVGHHHGHAKRPGPAGDPRADARA